MGGWEEETNCFIRKYTMDKYRVETHVCTIVCFTEDKLCDSKYSGFRNSDCCVRIYTNRTKTEINEI